VSVAPFEPVFPAQQPAERPSARPSRWRAILAEALVCLAVAVVIAGLGAPIGLLWRAVAPRVELVQTDFGPYPLEPEPEGYVADEGWFILIAVAAGLALAVLVWFVVRRYRGAPMLLALAAGSVGGSVLAAWLGHRVGLAEYQRLIEQAPVGTHIFRQPNIRLADVGLYWGWIPRVRGIVLIQALVASALYTGFAGFSYSPSLRPGHDESELPPGDGAAGGAADVPLGDGAADVPPRGAEPAPAAVSWDSPSYPGPAGSPEPPEPSAAAPPLDVAARAQREDD
jgi:hypothetical protein